MPLADKIIELRKKQGWSQIDLADRLDVSRQSVSKWEMAQAVPELDKIIKMSELFAVTTDYLLKDDAPTPEQTDAPPTPPTEAPPSVPEPEKPRRKKWPWALAACLVLVCVALAAKGAAARKGQTPPPVTQVSFADSTPTPAPMEATTEEAVIEDPTAASLEQTAVSDPDAPEAGMTEYTYEGDAVTAGGIDPEALAAIAAEYAPFGITCDGGGGQWYLDGEPIRVFTDILSSNGESLTGGRFQGTMRNFAGDGAIDVRTVRDFDRCDDEGHGTLLYLESCDIRLQDAHWVAHHPEDHHGEDHHE